MSKERLEEIITPVYIYEDLCNQIFGSSDSSGNDIFFDAFPDPEKNKGDRAAPLELDYITPHIQKDAEESEKINAEITEYKGKAEPSTGIEHMVRANATINPNPVTILKVESGVSFRFTFLLYDTIIENKNKNETVTVTAVHKKKLFMKILEDFGVGAKTNVGYGHLVPVEE